jgi:hypothetical protein
MSVAHRNVGDGDETLFPRVFPTGFTWVLSRLSRSIQQVVRSPADGTKKLYTWCQEVVWGYYPNGQFTTTEPKNGDDEPSRQREGVSKIREMISTSEYQENKMHLLERELEKVCTRPILQLVKLAMRKQSDFEAIIHLWRPVNPTSAPCGPNQTGYAPG